MSLINASLNTSFLSPYTLSRCSPYKIFQVVGGAAAAATLFATQFFQGIQVSFFNHSAVNGSLVKREVDLLLEKRICPLESYHEEKHFCPVLTLDQPTFDRDHWLTRAEEIMLEIEMQEAVQAEAFLKNRLCPLYDYKEKWHFCPAPSLDHPPSNEAHWRTWEEEDEIEKQQREIKLQEQLKKMDEAYEKKKAEDLAERARRDKEYEERQMKKQERNLREQEELAEWKKKFNERMAKLLKEVQEQKEQSVLLEQQWEIEKEQIEEEKAARAIEMEKERIKDEKEIDDEIRCKYFFQCGPSPEKQIDCPEVDASQYLEMSVIERAVNGTLIPECPEHAKIILGTDSEECQEAKKSAKQILKIVHPDKQKTEAEEVRGQAATRRVNEAIETLCKKR